MLTNFLINTRLRKCKHPPGRGGGRKGTGGSGRLAPGPLPAPRRAEESGPQFPQFLYRGAATHSVCASRPSSPALRASASASILPPYAAKLRVGPVPKVGSPGKLASPPLAPFLQGKPTACLYLAAIPPGLSAAPLARGPRDCLRFRYGNTPVRARSGTEKPSGRPGSGRPGRWRRQCRDKPATDRAGTPASAM